MEWIKLTKKSQPKENKIYMCYVPNCKHYNEHYGDYYWNGSNFIDDTYIGRNRIVKVTHYMTIVNPND